MSMNLKEATAIEKFTAALPEIIARQNRISLYWNLPVELVAQNGKVEIVKCAGFTFRSGKKSQ